VGFKDALKVNTIQIQIQDASELLLSLALFATAMVIIRYTRKKMKPLPSAERKAGRPLLLTAVGVFIMAMASLFHFIWAVNQSDLLLLYLFAAFAVLTPLFLSSAALIILGWKIAIVPLAGALGLVSVVVFASPVATPGFLSTTAMTISGLFNFLPAILYGYFLFKTRKATSLSLFYLIAVYPLRLLLTPGVITSEVVFNMVLGLTLLGPALAAAAFYYHDIGVSFELAGYAFAYAFIALWFSFAIAGPAITPIALTSLTLIAVGAAIGFGTSSYTYAKWKKSRARATFALFVSFMLATLSFLLAALQGIGAASAIEYTYAYMILTFAALMCFNLAAFFALEWESLLLLPVIMILPLIVYLVLQYPADPRMAPFFFQVISLTGILGTLVPVGLNLYLWRRMAKTNQPKASRPLLLAMGILALAIGMAAGPALMGMGSMDYANPISSTLILAAFLAWWLGVTGKMEGFSKWWLTRTTHSTSPAGGP